MYRQVPVIIVLASLPTQQNVTRSLHAELSSLLTGIADRSALYAGTAAPSIGPLLGIKEDFFIILYPFLNLASVTLSTIFLSSGGTLTVGPPVLLPRAQVVVARRLERLPGPRIYRFGSGIRAYGLRIPVIRHCFRASLGV